jgi:hypothetical protein
MERKAVMTIQSKSQGGNFLSIRASFRRFCICLMLTPQSLVLNRSPQVREDSL